MTRTFKRRDVLAGAGALAAAGRAFGQTPPAPPTPPIVFVTLRTEAGNIGMVLEMAKAPITAGNFLRYVTEKKLDGGTFYRALRPTMPGGPPYGIIQGGPDPKKPRFPAIAHEPTTQTGLSHVRGAVALANGGPGTATCDFYICIGGMEALDAKGTNAGFAVFGHVVDGMDVVEKINQMPTVEDAPNPDMKGQMLGAPVKILSATKLGA